MRDSEEFDFRPGVLADSRAIAQVHVESWRYVYDGLLPESVLGGHTVKARTAQWESWFRDGDHSTCWVAEDAGGRIVGFASGGPERTGEHGIDAELFTLYLSPSRLGIGIGTSLFLRVRADLGAQGSASMLAWVLEANAGARRFYERMGGEQLAEESLGFRGNPQTRVAYAWRNLEKGGNP